MVTRGIDSHAELGAGAERSWGFSYTMRSFILAVRLLFVKQLVELIQVCCVWLDIVHALIKLRFIV